MNSPVFRIAQQSTAELKAVRKALLAKDGHGTEDAALLALIRDVLNRRALGLEREDGWPTVLDDPEDDGLKF